MDCWREKILNAIKSTSFLSLNVPNLCPSFQPSPEPPTSPVSAASISTDRGNKVKPEKEGLKSPVKLIQYTNVRVAELCSDFEIPGGQ